MGIYEAIFMTHSLLKISLTPVTSKDHIDFRKRVNHSVPVAGDVKILLSLK